MHLSEQIGILYSLHVVLDCVNFHVISYIKLDKYSKTC